jgi:tetratricopeptide (TPR) repeat protein
MIRVLLKLRVGLYVALVLALGAARADEIERELDFASALARFGLPYYGSRVVERLLVQQPGAKERAKPVLAELMATSGRLKEAEEMVKALNPADPRTQTIQLVLANGYYSAGQFDKTRAIYDRFFKQAQRTTLGDTNFFRNAAYQYGQILEHAGDPLGAIGAYQHIVNLAPGSAEARQVQADQADLYLKLADATAAPSNRVAYLNQSLALCDKLFLNLDMWFGRALISKANALARLGKPEEARRVLHDQMDVMKQIDGVLKEQGPEAAALSPIAGARAALGDLYAQEGKELLKAKGPEAKVLAAFGAALTEYVNVLNKYPKSEVAPKVVVQAQDLVTQLQAMGRRPNVDLSRWTSLAKAAVFEPADELFRSGQYGKAIAEYEKLLKQFPTGDGAAAALGNLVLAYARTNQHEQAMAAAQDLGVRFAALPRAGVSLLQLAKFYEEQKDPVRMRATYDLFLKYFPKHERAGGVLYQLAFLANQAKEPEQAKKWLQRIVAELPNDALAPKAMSQLAWSDYAASNYVAAVRGFTAYLATAQPGPDKAQAQFFLATALRLTDEPRKALAEYETLINWLRQERDAYASTGADLQRNEELLEQAQFQVGVCHQAIKEPAGELEAQRQQALEAFDKFMAAYPRSKLAPKALRAQGAVYLALNKFKEATQVFDALAAKYPNTDEGKSALYSLAESALEVRQISQAREALEKMLASPDKFEPVLFLKLGQAFGAAQQPGDAVRCFALAAQRLAGQPLSEVALYSWGQAQLAAADFTGAVQTLEKLFQQFPNSGFFRDGKFALATAARQAGKFSQAEGALGDVMRQLGDKPAVFNKANLELAKVQRAQGAKEAALASCQRVALLGDAQNADLAPIIEEAFLESFKLGLELKQYDDVITNSDTYEKTFPQGQYLEEARKARNEAKAQAGSGT